jgi:hypothetical protein
MDAALLPLPGRESREEIQRLRPAPPKRDERLLGVVAQVLPFFGHAVGVRVAPSWVDVHDPDLLDARREDLLGVAQVANDLFGRPVLGIGPAREHAVALALDGGG